MMNKEKIMLSSKPIEISEFKNHKEATFLISVLDEFNLNDVKIEKAEGEKYYKTIIGYPIVAYLKYDADGKPDDFGGHELRVKFNEETKEIEYYFATYPIGSVIDAWIEQREVEGYEGLKDVIMIKTKLWSERLPEYFVVFDKLWEEGKISSSWEICVEESLSTLKGKILKIFEFVGNCILGSDVAPAVPGAGVLDVASNNDSNRELSNALLKDIQLSEKIKGGDKKKNKINSSENFINKEGGNNKMEKDLSSMTDNDLYTKVRRAINATDEEWYYIARLYPYEYRVVAYTWERETDDDYVEFFYTVNSDESISITSQKEKKMIFVDKEENETALSEKDTKIKKIEKDLSEKVDSITKLGEEISTLKTQVSNLEPFKTQVEEAEKQKQKQELVEKRENLKKFAATNSYITKEEIETSEEIKKMINELDENGIKLLIADRVIAKSKEKSIETSSTDKDAKANLNNGSDEGTLTATEIVKSWILK